MEAVFADVMERLDFLHGEMRRAISDLSVEALDWSPAEGANSMGAVVVHTLGAERYWVATVIFGQPSDRVRESEFLARGWLTVELFEQLDKLTTLERAVFETLGLEDLETLRRVPRDGREVTVSWALAHVIEHTAVHVGHLQLTRQLWDERARAHVGTN